jgi:hypothetical protein
MTDDFVHRSGLSFKAVGDDGTIEGYRSTFGNIDQGEDIVATDAFAAWLAAREDRPLPMQFAHRFDRVCGAWTSFTPDSDAEASKVELQTLAPEQSSITACDVATGVHLLVCGAARLTFVDKFLINTGIGAAIRREQIVPVFVRDPKVRAVILKRAGCRCEHCAKFGFRRSDGAVYVETHHIVPRHEG